MFNSEAASSVGFPTKHETGFSEAEALKHVKALTDLPVDSAHNNHIDPVLQYVLKESESIKETAGGDVIVSVDVVPSKSGDSDKKQVWLKVSPKSASVETNNNAVLVSAHVDYLLSREDDETSNVAVMLELARGLSQSAHDFKTSVVFLFSTDEEEDLSSHSFITQHPFGGTVRLAIDLNNIVPGARGSMNPTIHVFDDGKEGGKAGGAQKHVLDLDAFSTRRLPGKDLFSSGVIKSFDSQDIGAVTKSDKFGLLKHGSFQHLGENLLAFLNQTAISNDLPKNI